MRTATLQQLSGLQRNPAQIRNICILAHVDHGKTTLADALVANNGIISQRMAGKLRYLDSREDEQQRGITMKSSAISLHYTKDTKEYLVNLIDSPGHIDFSSEVSTAVRLCDGAVVLVDVVEGVCPQTVAVLRHAWLENIRPVLVLNKIDRLMSEWKMTPLEAHIHLMQLVEQVNAVTGELFASEHMERASAKVASPSPSADVADDKIYDWSAGLEDSDDSHIYFSPDQGNVVFGSALDGWGFSIDHFAHQWASKLGVNAEVLKKTLWGDFYLEMKTKRIRKGAQAKGKKPLFVQFVLDQLWAVYDAVTSRDKDKVDKIVKSLNLKISARDSRQTDTRVLLQAICGQWLPLSTAVLDMVVDKCPSPINMSRERVEKLLCPHTRSFDSLPPETQQLREDFLACSSADDAPVIVFVSKMFSIDKSALPSNRQRPLTQVELADRRENARRRHAERLAGNANGELKDEQINGVPLTVDGVAAETSATATADPQNGESHNAEVPEVAENKKPEYTTDQVFVAFARVFSGTVKKGQKLYVLGPKHDPAKALHLGGEIESDKTVAQLSRGCHITVATTDDLYLFMGRELEALEEVPAGNVLGMGGLEEHVLKSATLSNTVSCPAFTEMYHEAAPIVRVAVEPKHATDMGALMWGMRLLNQSDPSVEVLVQENGQHVVIAAGEVHLQKCLDDLQKLYAKIEVTRSAPIVPFRETVILPPETDMVNEAIVKPTAREANVKPTAREAIIKPTAREGSVKQTAREETKNNDNNETPEDKDRELVVITTPSKEATLRVRAFSLPDKVTQLLDDNQDLIKALAQHTTAYVAGRSDLQRGAKLNSESKTALKELKGKLTDEFQAAGKQWADATEQIWAFGPRLNGPNILLNRVPGYDRPNIWAGLEEATIGKLKPCDNSIINGFQMATLAGPLCEEPLRGVGYALEAWDVVIPTDELQAMTLQPSANQLQVPKALKPSQNQPKSSQQQGPSDSEVVDADSKSTGAPGAGKAAEEAESDDETTSNVSSARSSVSSMRSKHGPYSGQLMSTSKEAFRRAFQTQPQRLMVAMYTCTIQVTTEVLGKMYAVLGKRQGRILQEELLEGSSLFKVTAVLPVIESFGFSEETRKKTSGLASPQLRFTHWEVLDTDPFWVPTTDEEYAHFGEKADSENVSRVYMNNVRRRKGLYVNEKMVEFAEKQRTLTRNK